MVAMVAMVARTMAATMRAARLHGNSRVTLEERPVPAPGPGEVLLQMKAAGICGSDLHGYRAAEPARSVLAAIPGHEPCGVIVETGPDAGGWKAGDRAVVYHRTTCLTCHYCRTGRRNLCPNRGKDGRNAYGFVPDGADADYMVARAADLLPLPAAFDFVDGAVLACQTGTAYYGLRNVDTWAGDRVLVTGLGPVGLLAVLLAQAMGVDLIGVDPSPERRRLAAELGLERALDPAAAPLAEQVRACWPDGATVVAECSGAPAVHAILPALCDVTARVSIIGLGAHPPALGLASLMSKQITVVGSNLWPFSAWDEIAGFVADRKVPISRVVTHQLSLDEAPRGFDLAGNAAAGKVVFRFE
jgi:threonine dehydrogenase-like Zn-dependent dehydrogenase